MRRRTRPPLAPCVLALALACSGSKGDDDDDGDADTGDTAPDDSPCPDSVPEQYQWSWDCEANSCDDDQRMVYHWGSGSSTADGDIELSEQWFMFWDGGDSSCVDEMSLDGSYATESPEDFSCAGCEEIWEIDITLDEQGCDVGWGSTFNDEDNSSGPWTGFAMFDTHTAFGDRNPDDAMQIFMAPVNWDEMTYTLLTYGRGTAVPTGDDDSWPEDYEWVASGACYSIE